MARWLTCAVLVLASTQQGASSGTRASPPIHLHIFLSKTCADCEIVDKDALERLAARCVCSIVPHYYEVDSLGEYRRLVVLERRMGSVGNNLPVVFLGGHVLGGTAEIEAQLEGLLVGYAATGSPALEVPTAEEAAAILEPPARSGASGPVRLAYFEEPGCRQCARVARILHLAQERHENLTIRTFDRGSRSDRVLLEVLCERAGVAEERRLLLPALFVGRKALISDEISDDSLEAILAEPAAHATTSIWNADAQELAAAKKRLRQRLQNASVAAVLAGGLVDGVNPCAFAALVFLVCCLAGLGRGRAHTLAVGASFTFGVFAAYFVTGVGLSEVLLSLDLLPGLSRVVTWAIIAVAFALAFGNFRDWVIALRGKPTDMALKLPGRLRMRMNAFISRRLRSRRLVLTGFALGATVSLLEFVCTGQVYVPLIRYMTGVSGSRAQAMGLLLLYDAAFVVPLAVVFCLVYFGLSSQRLMTAFSRNIALTKLLLGAFFLGLGLLLIRLELAA